MDRELLEQHGEGIIALSGCPSGEMLAPLLDDRIEERRRRRGYYSDVFDDYYLELQDHGIDGVRGAEQALAAARAGDGHAAGRDQRLALPEARGRAATTCCSASAPTPPSTTRSA